MRIRSSANTRIRRMRMLQSGILAMLGLIAGFGLLKATSVFDLIPRDEPAIWVGSGCGYADATTRAALHADPDRPVYLIPLDQRSETAKSACRATLAALERAGYQQLSWFPESWLCQRLADAAASALGDEHVSLPLFFIGGQRICDGACDGQAFERIGRAELQQFMTLTGRTE